MGSFAEEDPIRREVLGESKELLEREMVGIAAIAAAAAAIWRAQAKGRGKRGEDNEMRWGGDKTSQIGRAHV